MWAGAANAAKGGPSNAHRPPCQRHRRRHLSHRSDRLRRPGRPGRAGCRHRGRRRLGAGSQIGSGAGQTIATAAGASLGAYAGGRLFAALPAADRRQARLAQAEALESAPSGQSVTWRNPDTGSSGEVNVNVQPAFAAADGGPCRHFAHRIEVDGRQESVAGTACRQTDGAWQVVAEE